MSPKITDFGLAKQLDDAAGLTASGAILGTPSYMAPEQATGRGWDVGPVTDVYALGAVLYEALTGRPPFRGATTLETLDQVRTQDPVGPRQLQPRLHRDLETICLKCLRKEPSQRYQGALELADDLRRFLAGEPVRARPIGMMARAARWARRRPTQAALIAVSSLALVALLVLALWFSARLGAADSDKLKAQLQRERSDATARLEETKRQEAEKLATTHAFFRWLQDAREKRQARVPGWTWNNLQELTKVLAANPEAKTLPELQTEVSATLGSIDARPLRVLAGDFPAAAVVYAPDGKFLALGQERLARSGAYLGCQVLFVDPGTGKTLRTLPFPPSALWTLQTGKVDGVRSLAISPNGAWLVAGTRSGTMHRWDLRADEPRPVTWQGHAGTIARLLFDRTGAVLYSVAEKDSLKRWITSDWSLTASYPSPREMPDLAYDPDAEVLILPGLQECQVLDAEFLHELHTLQRHHDCVVLAAAGQLLVGSGEHAVGCFDLALDSAAGDNRLPNKSMGIEGGIAQIALSPDGTLLAVASTDTRHVYLWDLLGGDVAVQLNVGVGMLKLAFSPDGQHLAVTRESGTLLFEIRSQGVLTRHALCAHPVLDLALSAQGNAMACRSDPSRPLGRYFIWPAPGSVDPEPARPRHFMQVYGPWPLQAALNADGTLLASGSDETFIVDRLLTERFVQSPLQTINHWGSDRLWTAAGSAVSVWKAFPPQRQGSWDNTIAVYTSGRGTITALQAGSRWTLAGARDGTLHVLAPSDARCLGNIRLGEDRLTSLALTADDALAAVGTEAGDIVLVKLRGGDQGAAEAVVGDILTRTRHEDEVTGLAFLTPTLLASASNDRSIRLWQVGQQGLTEMLRLPCPGMVRRLRVTPDGRQLLFFVAGERGIRCWHLDRLADAFGVYELAHNLPVHAPRAVPISTASSPSIPDGPGLVLREFWSRNFRLHVNTKIVAQVHLDCGTEKPSPLLPKDDFTLRWRGWLQAPRPGKYLFELEVDDGARLWLDGKLLLDRWARGRGTHQFAAEFTGQPRQIRVDYWEDSKRALCALRWAVPDGNNPPRFEAIPASAFFTGRAAARAKSNP